MVDFEIAKSVLEKQSCNGYAEYYAINRCVNCVDNKCPDIAKIKNLDIRTLPKSCKPSIEKFLAFSQANFDENSEVCAIPKIEDPIKPALKCPYLRAVACHQWLLSYSTLKRLHFKNTSSENVFHIGDKLALNSFKTISDSTYPKSPYNKMTTVKTMDELDRTENFIFHDSRLSDTVTMVSYGSESTRKCPTLKSSWQNGRKIQKIKFESCNTVRGTNTHTPISPSTNGIFSIAMTEWKSGCLSITNNQLIIDETCTRTESFNYNRFTGHIHLTSDDKKCLDLDTENYLVLSACRGKIMDATVFGYRK